MSGSPSPAEKAVVAPTPQDADTVVSTTLETKTRQARKTDFWLLPIPKPLRYDPERPAHFGLLLNSIFGFAATFIVANLYYCQPILIELSKYFDTDYDRIASIPTLVQGGYGVGLLLVAPLGDLYPRRPLLLGTVIASTALTIGLCITKSLKAFESLTFLVGVFSVAPQILIPLAADLAPPNRRASAMGVVLGGLLFGVLLARVLSGLIAQYANWRDVYYMALGAQAAVFFALWATLPDYPSKNPDLTYAKIMWSTLKISVTEPKLVQACIVGIASTCVFTSFWVTLTFVLGDAPYSYSTLVIGLFGLVGMVGVLLAPPIGRFVDGMVPWWAALGATVMLTLSMAIYWGAAGANVAAVVVTTVGLDVFRQLQQVSLVTNVMSISAAMRTRLNSVFIISLFVGQVIGSAVSTTIYTKYGWRAVGAFMFALSAFQVPVLLARGPHAKRYTWFGLEGGLEHRKSVVQAREKEAAERAEAERAGGEKGPSPPESVARDEKRDSPVDV